MRLLHYSVKNSSHSREFHGNKAEAGAILGTVVAGPLGTIAGAAIGGKKKDTSTAYIYLIDDDSVEHEVHVQCTKEQYTQISRIAY
ncbi:hypothetical protein V7068_14775 [Bacillus sp. JJ634]